MLEARALLRYLRVWVFSSHAFCIAWMSKKWIRHGVPYTSNREQANHASDWQGNGAFRLNTPALLKNCGEFASQFSNLCYSNLCCGLSSLRLRGLFDRQTQQALGRERTATPAPTGGGQSGLEQASADASCIREEQPKEATHNRLWCTPFTHAVLQQDVGQGRSSREQNPGRCRSASWQKNRTPPRRSNWNGRACHAATRQGWGRERMRVSRNQKRCALEWVCSRLEADGAATQLSRHHDTTTFTEKTVTQRDKTSHVSQLCAKVGEGKGKVCTQVTDRPVTLIVVINSEMDESLGARSQGSRRFERATYTAWQGSRCLCSVFEATMAWNPCVLACPSTPCWCPLLTWWGWHLEHRPHRSVQRKQ